MDLAAQLQQKYNVKVKADWADACLQHVLGENNIAGSNTNAVLEAAFGQFLHCDLNVAGCGSLPSNVKDLHKCHLPGKHILQCDELVNVCASAKERYKDKNDARCLKLTLTDGIQRISGIEYQPLPELSWATPAGCKVLVSDVPVLRGLLLLRPDNCVVLGGQVEALEEARGRAVGAWNKPAMGRSASEGPRNAFAEARAAAWQLPPSGTAAAGTGGSNGPVSRQPPGSQPVSTGAPAGNMPRGSALTRQQAPSGVYAGGEGTGSQPGSTGMPGGGIGGGSTGARQQAPNGVYAGGTGGGITAGAQPGSTSSLGGSIGGDGTAARQPPLRGVYTGGMGSGTAPVLSGTPASSIAGGSTAARLPPASGAYATGASCGSTVARQPSMNGTYAEGMGGGNEAVRQPASSGLYASGVGGSSAAARQPSASSVYASGAGDGTAVPRQPQWQQQPQAQWQQQQQRPPQQQPQQPQWQQPQQQQQPQWQQQQEQPQQQQQQSQQPLRQPPLQQSFPQQHQPQFQQHQLDNQLQQQPHWQQQQQHLPQQDLQHQPHLQQQQQNRQQHHVLEQQQQQYAEESAGISKRLRSEGVRCIEDEHFWQQDEDFDDVMEHEPRKQAQKPSGTIGAARPLPNLTTQQLRQTLQLPSLPVPTTAHHSGARAPPASVQLHPHSTQGPSHATSSQLPPPRAGKLSLTRRLASSQSDAPVTVDPPFGAPATSSLDLPPPDLYRLDMRSESASRLGGLEPVVAGDDDVIMIDLEEDDDRGDLLMGERDDAEALLHIQNQEGSFYDNNRSGFPESIDAGDHYAMRSEMHVPKLELKEEDDIELIADLEPDLICQGYGNAERSMEDLGIDLPAEMAERITNSPRNRSRIKREHIKLEEEDDIEILEDVEPDSTFQSRVKMEGIKEDRSRQITAEMAENTMTNTVNAPRVKKEKLNFTSVSGRGIKMEADACGDLAPCPNLLRGHIKIEAGTSYHSTPLHNFADTSTGLQPDQVETARLQRTDNRDLKVVDRNAGYATTGPHRSRSGHQYLADSRVLEGEQPSISSTSSSNNSKDNTTRSTRRTSAPDDEFAEAKLYTIHKNGSMTGREHAPTVLATGRATNRSNVILSGNKHAQHLSAAIPVASPSTSIATSRSTEGLSGHKHAQHLPAAAPAASCSTGNYYSDTSVQHPRVGSGCGGGQKGRPVKRDLSKAAPILLSYLPDLLAATWKFPVLVKVAGVVREMNGSVVVKIDDGSALVEVDVSDLYPELVHGPTVRHDEALDDNEREMLIGHISSIEHTLRTFLGVMVLEYSGHSANPPPHVVALQPFESAAQRIAFLEELQEEM